MWLTTQGQAQAKDGKENEMASTQVNLPMKITPLMINNNIIVPHMW